jgi:hypothetical protein
VLLQSVNQVVCGNCRRVRFIIEGGSCRGQFIAMSGCFPALYPVCALLWGGDRGSAGRDHDDAVGEG